MTYLGQFFLSAYLSVLRCTFSKIAVSFLRCVDHTGEQYWSIERTKLVYNFENNLGFLGPFVRPINRSTLFALFSGSMIDLI